MVPSTFDPDYVWVPVPRDRVIEVMRFIGSPPTDGTKSLSALEEHAPAPAPEPRPPDAAASRPRWRQEDLVDLIAYAHPKQLLVLQYLAQNHGRPVTAAELRDYLVEHRDISDISVERSGRALGAVMGALNKRSAWYDAHDPPFTGGWDPKRGENVYEMDDPDYARHILAALREHRPDEMGAAD